MHQNTQYINDINDINAAAEPECGRTAGNRAACILTGKAIDCNRGSFREKDIGNYLISAITVQTGYFLSACAG